MSMVERYQRMSTREQALFLSRLAWELTIEARSTYDPDSSDLTDPLKLRLVNETMHRIMGQLVAVTTQDLDRYPDEVIFEMILDPGEGLSLRRAANAAFAFVDANTKGPAQSRAAG